MSGEKHFLTARPISYKGCGRHGMLKQGLKNSMGEAVTQNVALSKKLNLKTLNSTQQKRIGIYWNKYFLKEV